MDNLESRIEEILKLKDGKGFVYPKSGKVNVEIEKNMKTICILDDTEEIEGISYSKK